MANDTTNETPSDKQQPTKGEQIVKLLDDYVNGLIENAIRDPGESSCGGTFNVYKYRAELVKALDEVLLP